MQSRNETLIKALHGSIEPLSEIPALLKDRDIYDDTGHVDCDFMMALLEFMSDLMTIENNAMKALQNMLGIDEQPAGKASKEDTGAKWSADEILKHCTLKDNMLKLPPTQFNKQSYAEAKKRIEEAGGEWVGGKIQAFRFPFDANRVFNQLHTTGRCNLAQEFQFFETPAEVADLLVSLVGGIRDTDDVLEPSAGRGALVKAIHRSCPSVIVDCYELMPENREILHGISGVRIKGENFITECHDTYSLIIANPPFSNNQDVDHTMKMYELLRTGGRMAVICSSHWKIGSEKKCAEFREWLQNVGAEVLDVKEGAFKESGTGIKTTMISIIKHYSETLF